MSGLGCSCYFGSIDFLQLRNKLSEKIDVHESQTMVLKSKNWETLFVTVIGFSFACFCALSMIDVYFRSPVVHGMSTHKPDITPPAKRLVLFVGI